MAPKPDVVVVGAGLIGLLTGCELAARGVRVLIVEKDDVGFEQSGRSVAAVNLPGGEPNPDPAAALFRVAAEQWSGFEQRWGCNIDLNDEGWFIVVADEEDRAWLETERSAYAATAGFPASTFLSADDARARFPQLAGPFLGLDVRHGGHVDAVMVMHGLRQVASRLGVEIRCGVMATGLEIRADAIRVVRTSEGPIDCGTLVVAAGIWSPYLCDGLDFRIPMQRVRAPAVEVGPVMPNSIPGFLRASRFGARQNRNGTVRITGGYRFSAMLHDLSLNDLRDVRLWAPRLWQNRREVSMRLDLPSIALDFAYAVKRRRSDGEAVVPQGFLPPASARDRVPQIEALGGLVPSLQGARISRFFSGVMDLMPDLQPIVGKIPGTENGYVNTGFSGHGYLTGPGACMALAELVHEGHTDIDLSRFTPERLTQAIPPMREQIF